MKRSSRRLAVPPVESSVAVLVHAKTLGPPVIPMTGGTFGHRKHSAPSGSARSCSADQTKSGYVLRSAEINARDVACVVGSPSSLVNRITTRRLGRLVSLGGGPVGTRKWAEFLVLCAQALDLCRRSCRRHLAVAF